MKRTKLFLLAMVTSGLAISTLASDSKTRIVSWNELIPKPEHYANPFSELSPEQLKALRKLLRFQQEDDNKSDVITSEEAAELRAELELDGLNIEKLFEQRLRIMEARRKVGNATNEQLLGQSVRIAGYMLPLEMSGLKVVEFLLVPTAGACIHTPPPPANQMVYVRYPNGFVSEGLYTPIWVSGKLLAESMVESVQYDDGVSKIESSYKINADKVDLY